MMENWNHGKHPEGHPAYVLVVLAVIAFMMLAVVLMFGCGAPVDVQEQDASSQSRKIDGAEEVDGGLYTPVDPGSLPLGFNERGCQWDGCTGPPDRLKVVSNPGESQP